MVFCPDDIVRAEQIQNELSATLQRVSQEIERDVGQFQAEKQVVLKRLAQSFAEIQIGHNQKVQRDAEQVFPVSSPDPLTDDILVAVGHRSHE